MEKILIALLLALAIAIAFMIIMTYLYSNIEAEVIKLRKDLEATEKAANDALEQAIEKQQFAFDTMREYRRRTRIEPMGQEVVYQDGKPVEIVAIEPEKEEITDGNVQAN